MNELFADSSAMSISPESVTLSACSAESGATTSGCGYNAHAANTVCAFFTLARVPGVVDREVIESAAGHVLHLRVILVPVHRADDAYVRSGCHERHLVGVVDREVIKNAAGHVLHLRVILVPVHRADDTYVRSGCHERHLVGVVGGPSVPVHCRICSYSSR